MCMQAVQPAPNTGIQGLQGSARSESLAHAEHVELLSGFDAALHP